MYQPAVLRILQVILHVKGAANTRIRDNWSEDVRAVDIIPQPGATVEHVRRVWVVIGWEAGRHRVPKQLEEVRVDSIKSILGRNTNDSKKLFFCDPANALPQ